MTRIRPTLVIAPVALAGALALGAGPAMAADTSSTSGPSTQAQASADSASSDGTLTLDRTSTPANEFFNWTKGIDADLSGLPAGQTVSITVTGPGSDSLVYDDTAKVYPMGTAHEHIYAETGDPDALVGTYTVTATLEDGTTLHQSFEVTPSQMNPEF